MRQFQLPDTDVVLGESRRDLRDFRRNTDERVDRGGKMRLENRPEPLQASARGLVEPVGLQAGGQFGVHFVLGHRWIGPARTRKGMNGPNGPRRS
jgi:hypothetical protein